MRPEAYRSLAERQKMYWWHRSRRALARSLLLGCGLRPGCRWLDLGCGPGGNFETLAPLSPTEVVGVDISPVALTFARAAEPNARLVEQDVNDPLPFPDAAFDVVTIFNVLYHQWITSEAAVLAEVARVLRPGGLLLMTEPSFAFLERDMDDAVMTRRRYALHDIERLLDAAGFDVRFDSYFTSFGVPILVVLKLLATITRRHRRPGTAVDMRPLPKLLNGTLEAAARLEGRLLARGVRLPFGTTLVCVAARRAP